MNTKVNTKSKSTMLRGKKKVKEQTLMLSPNSIRTFESCKARYIYQYMILPRIDSKRMKELAHIGSLFHEIASTNFEEKQMSSVLHFENKVTREELNELASMLKERDYFQFMSIREARMEVPVAGGLFQGIADRICWDGDKYIIVDYKTSQYPVWNIDRKQILAYAYMLNKSQAIEAEKIVLVLDYVRLNTINQFTIDETDIESYEGYLHRVYEDVLALRTQFLKQKDIKAIPHVPDNCVGCPVIGICKAYQLTINPDVDTLQPNTMTTSKMIEELIEREETARLYDGRIKVLKAALLARHQAGDKEIEEFYKIIVSNSTSYPARPVIDTILPNIVKNSILANGDRFIVDEGKIKEHLASILLQMLPENLSTNNIPADYLESVQALKTVTSKSPYLKTKRS